MIEPIQCGDPRDMPPPAIPPPTNVWTPKMERGDRFEVIKKIIIDTCKDPRYDNVDHITSVIITLSPHIDTYATARLREYWKIGDEYRGGRDLIKRIVELMTT